MFCRLMLPLFMLLGVVVVPARGEKANMSPERLARTATHVIVGTVAQVYERTETIGDWAYTRYVAEVRVDAWEKGKEAPSSDLAYVRYWKRRWAGEGRMPLSTSGHRGLPKAGDTRRIYLARNAYDGFTRGNNDGGFNVIGANGFEKLQEDSSK